MIRPLVTIKNCSTDFSVDVFFIFASSFSENSSLVFLFCFFFLGNIFFFLFFFFELSFPWLVTKLLPFIKCFQQLCHCLAPCTYLQQPWNNVLTILGWYIYDVHFDGSGGEPKMMCYLSDVGGWGSECCGRPIFILFIKEFAPRPDIMLSHTLIFHWQEIFLLTMTLDSKTIL